MRKVIGEACLLNGGDCSGDQCSSWRHLAVVEPHWRHAHSTFYTLVLACVWHNSKSTNLGMLPEMGGGRRKVAYKLREQRCDLWWLYPEGLAYKRSVHQCHLQTFLPT